MYVENYFIGNQISIHVPHEGDDMIKVSFHDFLLISIHVPHEGDDLFMT